MKTGREEGPARIGERARNAGKAIGECRKGAVLRGVGAVIGGVRTGEVAHHEHGVDMRGEIGAGGKGGGFIGGKAEARHAAIHLNRGGQANTALGGERTPARGLIGGVQHGDGAGIGAQLLGTGCKPVQNEKARIRRKQGEERDRLRQMRNEEIAAAHGCEHGGNTLCAKAVSIGFDHRGRARGGGARGNLAVIRSKCGQIDCEATAKPQIGREGVSVHAAQSIRRSFE